MTGHCGEALDIDVADLTLLPQIRSPALLALLSLLSALEVRLVCLLENHLHLFSPLRPFDVTVGHLDGFAARVGMPGDKLEESEETVGPSRARVIHLSGIPAQDDLAIIVTWPRG